MPGTGILPTRCPFIFLCICQPVGLLPHPKNRLVLPECFGAPVPSVQPSVQPLSPPHLIVKSHFTWVWPPWLVWFFNFIFPSVVKPMSFLNVRNLSYLIHGRRCSNYPQNRNKPKGRTLRQPSAETTQPGSGKKSRLR